MAEAMGWDGGRVPYMRGYIDGVEEAGDACRYWQAVGKVADGVGATVASVSQRGRPRKGGAQGPARGRADDARRLSDVVRLLGARANPASPAILLARDADGGYLALDALDRIDAAAGGALAISQAFEGAASDDERLALSGLGGAAAVCCRLVSRARAQIAMDASRHAPEGGRRELADFDDGGPSPDDACPQPR